MQRPIIVLFLFTFSGLLPEKVFSAAGDTSLTSCREKATGLLDEALAILQKNYYKKETVQWDLLRQKAVNRLETVRDCESAYAIVDWCFEQINEKHSFIVPPVKAAVYNYDTSQLTEPPPLHKLVGEIKYEIIDNQIGYITVPWVSTTDERICSRIADSLQQIIAGISGQGVSKWIIDLRNNRGGNCWPMLAGMGPLLGEGVCGYFVSATDKVPISYKNGTVYHGPRAQCSVKATTAEKISGKPWIAVLTGRYTSSSGELLALAFKGKEQVMLYGEPTAGFTTANNSYALSDRSMLVVTVCREADRTGKIYEGSIIPDERIVPDPQSQDEDITKNAAVMWLQSIWNKEGF